MDNYLPKYNIYAIAINNNASPFKLGQYNIGYTEFHACDISRVSLVNDDPIFHAGGTLMDCVQGPVVAGQIPVARPVSFRVWYPTRMQSGPSVAYGINDDIYPNSGVMATVNTSPSTNGALRDVPVASTSRGFPLIIFSPGSTGSGGDLADMEETLASHGFIVAGLDHANDYYPSYQGLNIYGLYSYPALGPFPAFTSQQLVSLRIGDVKFAIDEMLRRNSNIPGNNLFSTSIDPNKIGLKSYSFGDVAILGTAGGIQALGINPDSRVKALFKMDGPVYGNTHNPQSTYLSPYVGLSSSDIANIKIPVFDIFNEEPSSISNDFRMFQDLASNNVTMVRMSNNAHLGTGGNWCGTVNRS